MSKGFGLPQAQPADSGWKTEVKLKSGENATVVFLHGLNDGLSVYTHGKPVQINGQWKNIPSGNRNGHLFPPVVDVFDQHPDKDVAKTVLKRFALVYVLNATGKSAELKGKVAFVELKKEIFDTLSAWENATGKTLENREVAIARKGSGIQDTKYPTAILDPHAGNLNDVDVTEVRDYLQKLYCQPLTVEDLKAWYDACMVTPANAPQVHAHNPMGDEPEIAF